MQGFDATETTSGLGQPGRHRLPPGEGWSPDSSGKQRRSGAKIHRSTREDVLFGGGSTKHAGRRASSNAGSRDDGGRATTSRGVGCREARRARARRGQGKRQHRREAVRGTSRTPRSHTVERGAGWLRCGDLAMPGVREAEASARREARRFAGERRLRGRAPDDQRSWLRADEGTGATW